MFQLEPSLAPEELLKLLKSWLQQECDWMRVTTVEVSQLRDVIGWRFLAESERLALEHLDHYHKLLGHLIRLELELSEVFPLYQELVRLTTHYCQLISELRV